MYLTRTQILKGSYVYPSEMVALKKSRHFIQRLEERGIGLTCIPTMVRITKDNVHSGKTEDGNELTSVVVRINYNSSKFLFLCFNPIDGCLKTLWFRDKAK